MLESLRKAGVRWVKPHVPEHVWARLRRTLPRRPLPRHRPPVRAVELPEHRQPPRLPPGLRYSLESLATFYGTDKWGRHRYAQHYATHFAPLRSKRIALLEIGIGGYRRERTGGASLLMWKRYFPKGDIVGLDVHDKSFLDQERLTTYQGSQTDQVLLRRIAKRHGPFQIVIDDGSHRPEHIRATSAALFPQVADGGFYAIEDLQTSYWPRWGGSPDPQDPTTSMAMVKDLLDGLNYEEFGDGRPRRYTDAHVSAVHSYHNLVIVRKGPNREGGSRPANWDQVPAARRP